MVYTKVVLAYCMSLYCIVVAEKRVLTHDPQYVHGLEAKFQALETKVLGLESKIVLLENKVQGGVYSRWGRNICPGNTTELVYSGYAGGSLYDQTGAAADYVCLPKDPINHTYFTLSNYGRMYGAEYQGGSLDDQDVPCAVCRSIGYSSIVMISARNQCYPGWVEQYHGMLSSGHFAHTAATQYVCLDAEPEVVPHGHQDDNGKLFTTVTSQCGSLPCPPYTQGTALSCVVCAK